MMKANIRTVILLALQACFVVFAEDISSSSSSASSSSASSTASSDPYGRNFFVDSASTYYDGYQQAWRYLGWYVKCGYPSDRYNEDDGHSHHNDDGSTYTGNNYCQRFLIWAAVSGRG
jgi:hypothetical protein